MKVHQVDYHWRWNWGRIWNRFIPGLSFENIISFSKMGSMFSWDFWKYSQLYTEN
jgi:hypothetical protein